ncbi:hypothetical protein CJF42_09980 [Pseudoalteromonas sp. NBT06-2]|uniref:hypothetical protein n=1 Tax=Pseudoalteromonas sp. NBT06-2 TaxID=2025950 RepID=UPI000BA5CA66|nr:hypothetical protein [Pseudoalteromonas sp. NBT06-2]PAJ74541.1 hypothetical protein CJF42_09980 [Pseudoalteromonas sp. NBT06-2]
MRCNDQMILSQFWAEKVDSVTHGLTQLHEKLATLTEKPEQVIFVSAGEVKPLLNPDILAFCEDITRNFQCKTDFISAACTSLHASIFHFNSSLSNNCLVILLELDQKLQQGCLNALGVGNSENQDGLTVNDCIGFCFLEKRAALIQEIVIEQCQIFSQPTGIPGMPKLLNQLVTHIENVQSDGFFVSFDISSVWGGKLKAALKNRLKKSEKTTCWLSSIETDHRHYLSLKPILELNNYRHQLNKKPLTLFTLGGGGRVGSLRLSINTCNKSQIDDASFNEFCLTTDRALYQQSINVKPHSLQAYHAIVKATLKYPQLQYRGINNHYFRWPLNSINQAGVKS